MNKLVTILTATAIALSLSQITFAGPFGVQRGFIKEGVNAKTKESIEKKKTKESIKLNKIQSKI